MFWRGNIPGRRVRSVLAAQKGQEVGGRGISDLGGPISIRKTVYFAIDLSFQMTYTGIEYSYVSKHDAMEVLK